MKPGNILCETGNFTEWDNRQDEMKYWNFNEQKNDETTKLNAANTRQSTLHGNETTQTKSYSEAPKMKKRAPKQKETNFA